MDTRTHERTDQYMDVWTDGLDTDRRTQTFLESLYRVEKQVIRYGRVDERTGEQGDALFDWSLKLISKTKIYKNVNI